MAFLPSFTATSGSTLRLATCRGCVTCWPLSWSSWMMVSGWHCPSLQCCSSGSAWGGSAGSHTQWGEPWGASKARPCRAPLAVCVQWGGLLCVCVCCWHGHVGCRCCGARAAEHDFLCSPCRGSGFQLFHGADEKDESEFPPRGSHGHPLR